MIWLFILNVILWATVIGCCWIIWKQWNRIDELERDCDTLLDAALQAKWDSLLNKKLPDHFDADWWKK